MKKAIAYSLFGYNKEREKNSFDFNSYLRGLLLNIRMNRLIYPGWEIVLETDKSTYEGFKNLFTQLPITVNVNAPEPFTKAMLWRLKPVFEYTKYSHVICRDLDGVSTYREAQCVQEWLNSGKAAHAMTDSISHDVYMMGGMIGFDTGLWPVRTGFQHWYTMFDNTSYDFSRKGMDQTFLNKHVYPCYGNRDNPSIIQHYLLGIGQTFLDGYRNQIPNIEVDGVSREMEESNGASEHIGMAGWNNVPLFAFLRKHKDKFEDLRSIEKSFTNVAYWINDGTL